MFQSITYTAPVRECPTFDNVLIDMYLKLMFQIKSTPQDVKNFVYLLGASRFDEFLYASVQEAVRTMVKLLPIVATSVLTCIISISTGARDLLL